MTNQVHPEIRVLDEAELDLVSGGADNAKIAAQVIDGMKYVGAYVEMIIAFNSGTLQCVHGVCL
jgi:hypothetical protein